MFKNTIRMAETGSEIKITLFTEFKEEVIAVTELMSYEPEEIEKAENYIKWYEDNGAEVERVIYEGMSVNDDSQYF